MNYTDLKTAIASTCENTFEADDYARFVSQTEQRIYQLVQAPAFRKNVTGTATTSNKYITVPTDFENVYSIAVIEATGRYHFLVVKDVNFIREAYPIATSVGVPKYYSIFDDDSLILGPTPDADYAVELHYGFYPESIVTANTTWLGEHFDNALLNGSLVEAIRFMKGEEDIVKMYDKMYMESVALLKSLVDGKLRQDSYRNGQAQVPVQ